MWQLKSEISHMDPVKLQLRVSSISLVKLVTKAKAAMTGFKLKNDKMKLRKCRECRKHKLVCSSSGDAVVTVLSRLDDTFRI